MKLALLVYKCSLVNKAGRRLHQLPSHCCWCRSRRTTAVVDKCAKIVRRCLQGLVQLIADKLSHSSNFESRRTLRLATLFNSIIRRMRLFIYILIYGDRAILVTDPRLLKVFKLMSNLRRKLTFSKLVLKHSSFLALS